jgi:selenide,water dikinase
MKGDDRAKHIISNEDAEEAYFKSVESMATLNKNGASLMNKYECHGATDITGFGIKGHA